MYKYVIPLAASLFLGAGITTLSYAGEDSDEVAYGWQIMSKEEQMEYRRHMRSLKTEEERATFRREHHEKMKERAERQGIELPDEPMREHGMGPGMGSGRGGNHRMGPPGGDMRY